LRSGSGDGDLEGRGFVFSFAGDGDLKSLIEEYILGEEA